MSPETTVKSARRALEILERFESLQRPASVGELAAALGYPISSTSVLVHTLTQLGYLNFDSTTRQFAPTIRVALLGGWIRDSDPGRAGMKALLEDAHRRTGLTVVLSTRNGLDVQYLYVVRAPETGYRSRRPGMGTLRSILHGSAGIVLLARARDEEIALLVRGAEATSRPTARLEEVMQRVAFARSHGYAWNAGGMFPDVGSVSLPLPITDVFGKPLVLTVAGSASRIETEHAQLAAVLKRVIRRHARSGRATQVSGVAAGASSQRGQARG